MVDAPARSAPRLMLLAGVLLTGFALRPAVTGVGALLPVLRTALPLGPVAAGLTAAQAVVGLLAARVRAPLTTGAAPRGTASPTADPALTG